MKEPDPMNTLTKKNRNLPALAIAAALILLPIAALTVSSVAALRAVFTARAADPAVQEAFR
jgi:hypothetical protein